jgi:predicted O-methyltransferase YrrM
MKNLKEFSDQFSPGRVVDIKLRDLLKLRNQEKLLREITIRFPPEGIGSITLVDQIVLLCLEELVQPRKILEIGTFQGYTTALLASNSNAEQIFSVDLPKVNTSILDKPDSLRVLADAQYNDDYLRDLQNATGEIYIDSLDEQVRRRISLIKADSTSLNFKTAVGSFQFAFIDGGHNYDVVLSDSSQVLGLIKQGVIIWHDYTSGIHSDVTRFLAEYARDNLVFHVTGSLCAFQVIY